MVNKYKFFVKKILLFCLGVLPLQGIAQVSINAQLPSGAMVQKEQLWNVSLLSNQPDILEVYIKLSLQDVITNQVVLSAETGSLLLNKGIKLLNNQTVQPIFYNFTGPEFSRTFLPVGSYIACYEAYQTRGEHQLILANECIRFTVDPLSPPLLNVPEDKSLLNTSYPFFTWMPPTPTDMFGFLTYDLIVTELIDGQSPAEAIEYNTPVYVKTNLTQPSDNYPASFAKLDTAKTYAWQVIARNGISYAAKTETWTFRVAPTERPINIVAISPYLHLKQDNPEKGIAPNGFLKLAYDNKTVDKSISIQILDLSVPDDKDQPIIIQTNLIQGENYIELDLKKVLKPDKNKVYMARLVNSKGESWLLRFQIKNY